MRDQRLPLRVAIPCVVIWASLMWGAILTLMVRVWR